MRRDFGGHADRDAGGAVEQCERQPGREQFRFLRRAVVVRLEIDGIHVDFVEQQFGDRRQAGFGITHRRGAVAVARTEVALAVDQRIAQRKILRHAHQSVIDRLVAVRMQFTEHFTDHQRRFARFGGRAQAELVHREQNAALYRFLAVGAVRQRASLDYRDGVFEIGAFGEGGEGQRFAFGGGRFRRGKQIGLFRHGAVSVLF